MKTGNYWNQQNGKLTSQEELTQMAKDDYEKSSAKSKLSTLSQMKKIDETCASLNKFADALENNKPIIFYSIGTTGMKADDELMQLGVAAMNTGKDAEGRTFIYAEGRTFIFPVSLDAIKRAEENKDYDIFENGGFDRPIEKNGLGISKDEYLKICKENEGGVKPEYKNKRVYDYFREIGFANYSEIASKGAVIVGLNPKFAEPFLEAKQLGLFKGSIDILDIIKEFDFSQNDILNVNGSRYSLAGVAEQYEGKYNNGDGKLYSVQNKLDAMIGITDVISEKLGFKTKDIPEKTVSVEKGVIDSTKSRAQEIDEMMSKLIEAFKDVLVVTTLKTIEDNTKAMKELTNAIMNGGTTRGDKSNEEYEEPEEDIER